MNAEELARALGESPAVFALTMEGMALSARDAEALEERLRQRPDDLETRARLVGYHGGLALGVARAGSPLLAHVRWLVEHAPDSALAGSTYVQGVPAEERPAIEALWRRAVASERASAATLLNAARFLRPTAPDEAARLVREARRLDPSIAEPPSVEELMRALPPAPVESAAGTFPSTFPSTFHARTEALQAALREGRGASMEDAARSLLEEAETVRHDWNHGNAVHYAHTALGLAALERGEVAEASRQLLQAGATPGSPQLDSFGPTFVLAERLLEAGERVAVLAYLDLCARFWTFGRGRLDAWRRELHTGGRPRLQMKPHT